MTDAPGPATLSADSTLSAESVQSPDGAATGPSADLLTVAVVDDHLMFAESLARLLSEAGDITVVGIATTAAAAMSLASTHHPRIVLVDYQLPDRNGVELAAELKQLDPEIVVVMLTGANDDRLLIAAIEAGCSGFLTKDRASAEVVAAVRAAAEGEALISPEMLARLLPMLQRGHRAPGADLTARERQILEQMADGRTNAAIAAGLHLSVNTIRNYVQAILTKLGAHSKLEAVAIAVREGVITNRAGQ